MPKQLAAQISMQLNIPTIGIGAGNDTDGQVLVYHDIITYGVGRVPKFVKPFASVQDEIVRGITQYTKEVKKQDNFQAKNNLSQ
ncbi:hypothetical protein GCM10020331_067290 [Ectobacillus funiculus]